MSTTCTSRCLSAVGLFVCVVRNVDADLHDVWQVALMWGICVFIHIKRTRRGIPVILMR